MSFFFLFLFFFNDTVTTVIYTLSLHDALPISRLSTAARFSAQRLRPWRTRGRTSAPHTRRPPHQNARVLDRKSTRLNSSHGYISYAVFCLKKKNIFDLTNEINIPHILSIANYQ